MRDYAKIIKLRDKIRRINEKIKNLMIRKSRIRKELRDVYAKNKNRKGRHFNEGRSR